jgi:digeranylgeranylglycerophospholipid reductase
LHDQIFDVVVVGAGPAGTRAARDLASAGYRVALLEEHRQVGLPCHCSGLISPRALREAAVGEDIVLNDVRGATFHFSPAHRLEIRGTRTHAHVIDRVELDRRLACQAAVAGAELFLRTRFLRFAIEHSHADSRVIVHILSNGTEGHLRSRVLIGADGAFSRVRRQLLGHAVERHVSALGAHAFYDANPRPDHVEVFIDQLAAPGWFGWTIPLSPRYARIGVGTSNSPRASENLARLKSSFPESFGRARIQSLSGGRIPIWRPGVLAVERVLLVGDAARQVKPTSGGGIYLALRAAGLAADVVARALRRSHVASTDLMEYQSAWNSTLGTELRKQQLLRATADRLSPAVLHRIGATLSAKDLLPRLEASADLDFHSAIGGMILRQDPALFIRLALAEMGGPADAATLQAS